ncbi:MAG: SGNH/GDSL hydrolase family protein [Betaproteobacteria bacterium]
MIQWLPGSAAAMPYSNLFIFGDSLADSGNNAIALDNSGPPPGTLRTQTPMLNPVQISTLPYSSNRYSNGPVWTEYFAGRMGLSALPSLAGGTNFAFGGANTGPYGSGFPYSMLDQVSFFMAGTGGIAPSNALYVLEGGGNDARGIIEMAAMGGDPGAWIAGYAANVANIIGQLKAAGAHDILLMNVPDISRIPAIQALGPALAAQAQMLVAAMNGALGNALAGMSPAQKDGIHFFDLFGLMDDVYAHPGSYGLTDVHDACGAIAACVADPTGYFFWDGIHPTTAVHEILGNAAFASLQIPEPSSLILALLAVGMLGFSRTRRGGARHGF